MTLMRLRALLVVLVFSAVALVALASQLFAPYLGTRLFELL